MAFGRLERSAGPQPMSDINVTPLVDVMLVLVVIFIITAPLLVGAVKVDLPQSQATSSASESHFLALSIDKDGQVFLGDQALSAQELTQALQSAAQAHPETEVQLRADASVPYGRVVEVMGLAHQAGLYRIGFVAEPLHRSAQ
ncbi:MAG: ExbD/TolR family protein [Rhodoferax sp.]